MCMLRRLANMLTKRDVAEPEWKRGLSEPHRDRAWAMGAEWCPGSVGIAPPCTADPHRDTTNPRAAQISPDENLLPMRRTILSA